MKSEVESIRTETCKPYRVRMGCGHIEDRLMREATAGIPWTEDAIVDNSNGAECAACRKAKGQG